MLSQLFSGSVAALLLLAAGRVAAQTTTSCSPINSTCPPDEALGTTATWNFTGGYMADSKVWNITDGDNIDWQENGAQFTIKEQGDAPLLISQFYIFFGRVSTVMQTAPGQGIVSSMTLLSDDLDEIDWEFVGGNSTSGQTNYFSKGDSSTPGRGASYNMTDTQSGFHNYTFNWNQSQIGWYVDDQLVRTLTYDQAGNGSTFPQTPMRVKLAPWAGGDPKLNLPGVVTWAGGDVDYSKGPFTMTVQSLEVEDFSTGSLYTYGDHSGTYQSIQIQSGNSTIANRLGRPVGVKQDFQSLPKGAQIAIIAGIIGVVVILFIGLVIFCIKSRKAGRKERAVADAEWEKSMTELRSYKRMMASEEEIHPRAGYI